MVYCSRGRDMTFCNLATDLKDPVLAVTWSLSLSIIHQVMNYNTRQLPKFLLFNDWDQDARLKRLPDTLRRPE